ncbi:P-loop NTPase fold protein [Streptomyces sp. NPDC002564]|uniref:P-loop NTPase fold protein n=1 Tax=Streptomyces sp. NPDC002564 TaxID=3364649 RepID=UPI00367D3154
MVTSSLTSSQLTPQELERFEEQENELLDRALSEAAEGMLPLPTESDRAAARSRLEGSAALEKYSNWRSAFLAVIAAERDLRSRRPESIRIIVGFFVSVAILATSLLATLEEITLPVPEYLNWWVSALALIASAFLVSFLGARRRPLLEELGRASTKVDDHENRLAAALRTEAQATLSSVVNERRERGSSQQATLDSTKAPILVELDTMDAVPSSSAREVMDFIKEHRTSAIGISGTRGIGKSTLMHWICRRDPERYLSVYLPIPVQYSAPEFFRVLFRAVAEAVLASYGAEHYQFQRRRREMFKVELTRLVVSLLFALAGLGLIAIGRSKGVGPFEASDVPGLLLVLTGVATLIVSIRSSNFLVSLVSDALSPRRREGMAVSAINVLESLEFSTTQQTASKNTFTVNLFSMEDSSQVERAERELTHPELVAKFKGFVTAYTRSRLEYSYQDAPREIIVVLDELDKMEAGEDALAFVNSVKDLLHIDGVHFLISVSEDALHNFSLRGVPLRDAFDSSFDAIIPVKRFTIAESENLLQRRVVGFPFPLILFCHAMSGGLPRDLIRIARQCVSVRRADDRAVPLETVVWTVTQQQAISVVEALGAKVRDSHSALLAVVIESLVEVRRADDEGALVSALDDAVGRIRAAAPEDFPLALHAATYLSCISTLCSHFAVSRTNGEWDAEPSASTSVKVSDSVRGAIEVLQIDSTAAMSVLEAVRADLGLRQT